MIYKNDIKFQWLNIKGNEVNVLKWSILYVFFLFIAYYLLRPVRDELGISGGVHHLPWLFTGTLMAMLLLTPIYSLLVKNHPRMDVVKLSYRFFSINLIMFFIFLHPYFSEYRTWTGRFFFIWLSVFNLFVVSIFWSVIVDVFTSEQGTRLFGLLSAGATVGALVGSFLTLVLTKLIDQQGLVLLAFVMLEVSLLSAKQAVAHTDGLRMGNAQRRPVLEMPVGGTLFAGITHTLRSPYLSGISLFMIFYSITSTFLYMEQATIAATAFSGRAERTEFFAAIDLWVNVITLLFQLFLTSRILKWFGIAFTLSILPLITLAGFSILLAFPGLIVFIVIQVIRRVSNFAFARPGREILFTHVRKEDRYKSKNFIDTVVYRLGDQMGSWSYSGVMSLGASSMLLSCIAIPVSIAWLALSLWLGRKSSLNTPQ